MRIFTLSKQLRWVGWFLVGLMATVLLVFGHSDEHQAVQAASVDGVHQSAFVPLFENNLVIQPTNSQNSGFMSEGTTYVNESFYH